MRVRSKEYSSAKIIRFVQSALIRGQLLLHEFLSPDVHRLSSSLKRCTPGHLPALLTRCGRLTVEGCFPLQRGVMNRRGNESHIHLRLPIIIFSFNAVRLFLPLIETRDKASIQSTRLEFFVSHNFTEERKRRLNTANFILIERSAQAINTLASRAPPNREF